MWLSYRSHHHHHHRRHQFLLLSEFSSRILCSSGPQEQRVPLSSRFFRQTCCTAPSASSQIWAGGENENRVYILHLWVCRGSGSVSPEPLERKKKSFLHINRMMRDRDWSVRKLVFRNLNKLWYDLFYQMMFCVTLDAGLSFKRPCKNNALN